MGGASLKRIAVAHPPSRLARLDQPARDLARGGEFDELLSQERQRFQKLLSLERRQLEEQRRHIEEQMATRRQQLELQMARNRQLYGEQIAWEYQQFNELVTRERQHIWELFAQEQDRRSAERERQGQLIQGLLQEVRFRNQQIWYLQQSQQPSQAVHFSPPVKMEVEVKAHVEMEVEREDLGSPIAASHRD